MKKIGFIGLGIMGKPMAKNLIKAGYELTVYDINKESVDEVCGAGAVRGESIKEVTEGSEVLITMLPNSPHVKEVVLGSGGVLESIKEGCIFVDMSSIAPLVSCELAEKIASKGAVMFDAPVSGGEPKAIDGTLSIMVGGPKQSFEKVEGILLSMGSSAVLVGEVGSGNTAKLANQMIVALNIAAVSEAMMFVKKAGVDPEKVYNAIRGGLAGSTVMDAKVPLALKRNFKPGFRIELHIKDLANALETAHETGMPVPMTASVMEMLQYLKADGKAGQDHGGIIQYYEKLAGRELTD